jgi:hypothetical protein
MPAPLALEIIEYAFASDKPTYRAALAAVAGARKVRPVFMERQPRVERHQTMLATLTRPALETAAGTLIRHWLVKKHTAMLKDFLDHLGIKHEEGVVESLPEKMEDDKLKAAVEMLLSKYPKEAVTVYLNAFNTMNETSWSNLKGILEGDSRLQF